MLEKELPHYPVYIPSKGRADACLTARNLERYGVPFHLVIERQEYRAYARRFGEKPLLVLPFSNRGSVIPARNWIKDHATAAGYVRHWQLDDNMRGFMRWYKGHRISIDAGIALRVVEDFTDRYENIAISGMNYSMFGTGSLTPFSLNAHVYSCSLILNGTPHRWRGRYNEDADMCLQVLADGWCTILINAFLVQKIATMRVRGGNTEELYRDDGRLKMARSLERLWPGVVTTKRRFRRPQHVVKYNWARFDTPLKLKEGITLESFRPIDEYGMNLTARKSVRGERVKALYEGYHGNPADRTEGGL